MLKFEEFKQSICTVCKHCHDYQLNRATSTFCYEAYKINSSIFIQHIYQKLRKLPNWPVAYYKEEECFTNVFCKSKLCGNTEGQECKNFKSCLDIFTSTHVSYVIKVVNYNTLPFKIKIDKPAIIFGGSENWIKTVKKMGE